ncbi:MAG: GNAT family N-acetyltransferase [Candidatus Heimdallarchaeota archaeon]|nr:GNAT family N-acetyltransferase [Candidatus Heimdallarchaeota archaeon]
MIREYRVEDHQEIIEICKEIWEGNDYLPFVINSMVEDPTCHPTVLIDDNKIMSVVNLRLFNKDIGWSEALRTHPKYRGRGFASKLQNHQIQLAKDLGCKEIWLSTGESNVATRKILENMGFREKNKFYLRNITDYKSISTYPEVEKINISRATELLSKLEFPYLFGPFKVFPIESDYIRYYQNHIYCIKNRTLLTVKESTERDSDLILGFNGNFDDLEEAIEFAASFNYQTIKLFTPSSTSLKEDRVFRLMNYTLG